MNLETTIENLIRIVERAERHAREQSGPAKATLVQSAEPAQSMPGWERRPDSLACPGQGQGQGQQTMEASRWLRVQ